MSGRKCGHRGDKITSFTAPPPIPGTFRDPALEQFPTVKACRICCDCDAWLPLGPARDTPEVHVEIRAAELVAQWAPLYGASRLTVDGWYCHRDGYAPNIDHDDSWAGWLAREIAES